MKFRERERKFNSSAFAFAFFDQILDLFGVLLENPVLDFPSPRREAQEEEDI